MPHRMVGPFIFFDHMGPADFAPGAGIDVRPHPHIGLATVTYLFEGEILHRDSLGTVQSIAPGDVNWMTAGRGIVHSERTAPDLRRTGARMQGCKPGSRSRKRTSSPTRVQPSPQGDAAADFRAGRGAAGRRGQRLRQALPRAGAHADALRRRRDGRGRAFELEAGHEERAVYALEGDVTVSGTPLRGSIWRSSRIARPSK